MENFPININVEQLNTDAIHLVQQFQHEWKNKDLNVKVFTDGITNRLVGVYLKQKPDDIILVRVYGDGTELFINREAEIRNMDLMHKAGLSPPLFARFKNGICYGFSPGKVLDEKLVRDPVISGWIAEKMARMHKITIQTENNLEISKPCLFKIFDKYLELIPTTFEDALKNERLKTLLPNKQSLISDIKVLEKILVAEASPIVFCHNDLLVKNIVLNKDNNGVSFIDFEYGDFNYLAYDIANHFCEYAGVETYDNDLYPGKQMQMDWLQKYLKFSKGSDFLDEDVEKLYVQVDKFSLASHLTWGLWALVQAKYSKLDFDFLGYSILRINDFLKGKKRIYK